MELDASDENGRRNDGSCGEESPAGNGAACAGADGNRTPGPDRRKDRVERRTGAQRRTLAAADAGFTGPDRRKAEDRRTGLERRRGPGRRRSDDRKSAEEGEMSDYQFEFVMAIQTYKRVNKRMYPTWTEILEVLQQLGYRKTEQRKIRLECPEPPLMTGDAA